MLRGSLKWRFLRMQKNDALNYPLEPLVMRLIKNHAGSLDAGIFR